MCFSQLKSSHSCKLIRLWGHVIKLSQKPFVARFVMIVHQKSAILDRVKSLEAACATIFAFLF